MNATSLQDFTRLADTRQGQRVAALERLQGSEEVRFLQGSQGPIYLRTDLDVCTDGSGPSHGDTSHQDQTAGAYTDGTYLNADVTPYLVLPPQAFKLLGLSHARVADQAVIRYQDRWVPALVGEVGPRTKTGEASYRALQVLTGNHDVNPNSGKLAGGVETIIFPGSGSGQRWTLENTTAEALGPGVQELMRAQLNAQAPAEPAGCWNWLV